MDQRPDVHALNGELRRVADGVVKIFDADFCRVWMTGPGDRCDQDCMHAMVKEGPHVCRSRDRCLKLMSSAGRYTHTDGKVHGRVPFGAYKIGRIAASMDAKFLTNDAANDPRIHDPAWVRQLGLVSFAGDVRIYPRQSRMFAFFKVVDGT